MTIGQSVYLVESNAAVRRVILLREFGSMCMIGFPETGGAIRVWKSRLHERQEDAQAVVDAHKKEPPVSDTKDDLYSMCEPELFSTELQRRYELDHTGKPY